MVGWPTQYKIPIKIQCQPTAWGSQYKVIRLKWRALSWIQKKLGNTVKDISTWWFYVNAGEKTLNIKLETWLFEIKHSKRYGGDQQSG